LSEIVEFLCCLHRSSCCLFEPPDGEFAIDVSGSIVIAGVPVCNASTL
jgi:hypothetical protein